MRVASNTSPGISSYLSSTSTRAARPGNTGTVSSKTADQPYAVSVSAADRAARQRLLTSAGDETGELALLTGRSFPQGAGVDYLAVRTGGGVTPTYAEGEPLLTIVWGDGTNINYFAAPEGSGGMKGVAITFGAEATAADKARYIKDAGTYLDRHLGDHQDAHGRWNTTPFDQFS